MSIELMSKVWRSAPYDGSNLLALLACADWANDEGEFYPSYSKIGAKVRRSRRSAIRLVSGFVNAGFVIKIKRRNTGEANRSNMFYLHVGQCLAEASSSKQPEKSCPYCQKYQKLVEDSAANVTITKESKKTVDGVVSDTRIVTPTTPYSVKSVTRDSDSHVTHIHHVEPSGYPPVIPIENSQANFHDNNNHIEPKPPHGESVDIGVNVSSETTPHQTREALPTENAKLSLVSNAKPKRVGKGRQKPVDPPSDPVSASLDTPTASAHKQMSDALNAFGQKILNWGAQGKAIQRILAGGYTAEQAIECLNWLADPKSGWPGRADWLIVQQQIPDYFRRKASKSQQPVKEPTTYEQPRTESPRFAPATLKYLSQIGYGIEEAS